MLYTLCHSNTILSINLIYEDISTVVYLITLVKQTNVQSDNIGFVMKSQIVSI